MDNLRCLSCGKEMSKHYLYCFKCHKDFENMPTCEGLKLSGEQCTIRTNQKYCIYHVPKTLENVCTGRYKPKKNNFNKKYQFTDDEETI